MEQMPFDPRDEHGQSVVAQRPPRRHRRRFRWAIPLSILAIGVAGEMRCLDKSSGKLLWKKDLPAEFGRQRRDEEYGYSASPLRYRDFMIVQVGGDEHGVVAMRPKDGSIVWASAPTTVSYAQASIVRLRGRALLHRRRAQRRHHPLCLPAPSRAGQRPAAQPG